MDRFEHSLEVNASAQSCYDRWHDFEKFPEFMQNVKSVTPGEGEIYHWVVNGPMGKNVEYDAAIDADDEGSVISWKSVDNGLLDLQVAGEVRFEETDANHCRITAAVEYDAPMGALGNTVANIFSNPEKMVVEDLENFKAMIEEREHSYSGPFGLEDEAIGDDADSLAVSESPEDTPYIGLKLDTFGQDELEMRDGDGYRAEAEAVEKPPETFSDDGETLQEVDVFTSSMDIHHEDMENFVAGFDEEIDAALPGGNDFESYLSGEPEDASEEALVGDAGIDSEDSKR